MDDSQGSIAPALLAWHRDQGRHDLPWQRDRSPYRVWVSEVMLQQTQVAAVIPYFERFVAQFPDIPTLARASQDQVLHLWSGLGYYARARNLQRAAQVMLESHGGQFPRDFVAVEALPGIGRSTAGAILAISSGQRHAILDGNVRRVLARVHAVPGSSGQRDFEQKLWQLAEANTPDTGVDTYTQAIMDLGATLCMRRRPQCGRCPLATRCAAHAQGEEERYPAPKRPLQRRRVERWMLFARRADGAVRLVRRPVRGVWGGLWSPPEFESAEAARKATGADVAIRQAPALQHAFTHFDLTIHPLWFVADGNASPGTLWYNAAAPAQVGLPAPIAALLAQLPGET
jgi:A/G-specific adenine glycosylase